MKAFDDDCAAIVVAAAFADAALVAGWSTLINPGQSSESGQPYGVDTKGFVGAGSPREQYGEKARRVNRKTKYILSIGLQGVARLNHA